MKIFFRIIPVLAFNMAGPHLYMKLMLVVRMYYFILTRKLKLFSGDFGLTLELDKKNHVFFVRQPMDLRALAEVFVDMEYEWAPSKNFKPNTIIDLGAHIGDTALYYHKCYPNARIIAVEASPSSYERLVKNVSGIKNIETVFAAIGPFDGEVLFNVSNSSLGSSVLMRSDIKSSKIVPQITLNSLFRDKNIQKADLIKFDIEGGEFALFKDINPEDYSRSYRGELHFDLVKESKENFLLRFSAFTTTMDMMKKEGRYLFSASNFMKK